MSEVELALVDMTREPVQVIGTLQVKKDRQRPARLTAAMCAMLALLAAGCRDKVIIPEGRPLIMTDESGRRYVVGFHTGNVYTVDTKQEESHGN